MSSPRAYYNEIDPFAAEFLRNLIADGHIAPGDVDERDIRDVRPVDLRGYTQCHFFAGIGVWSHALRQAGWPDDRPVWTGSCPCQPFAAAGRKQGFDDERHLWPHWHHLIRLCRPESVFGEQVATNDGLAWLDLVSSDLEGEDYALGAFDLCAASVGAPHIRQRLYFAAYDLRSPLRWLDHGHDEGLEGHAGHGDDRQEPGRLDQEAGGSVAPAGAPRGLADADSGDPRGLADGDVSGQHPGSRDREVWAPGDEAGDHPGRGGPAGRPGPANGFWGPSDWLLCDDPDGPRWRAVEPGTFPLAHGVAARVGRLSAYGNAIVGPLATEFIKASIDALREGAGRDRQLPRPDARGEDRQLPRNLTDDIDAFLGV